MFCDVSHNKEGVRDKKKKKKTLLLSSHGLYTFFRLSTYLYMFIQDLFSRISMFAIQFYHDTTIISGIIWSCLCGECLSYISVYPKRNKARKKTRERLKWDVIWDEKFWIKCDIW